MIRPAYEEMICLKRTTVVFAAISVLFLFLPSVAAAGVPPEQARALEILDSRTSLRWGEENLAWIVHYPEMLVEPWVKTESAKRKMSAEQAEQYRKAFTDELKIGSATAVMLSVHAFGAKPLNLAPISKNVALIDSSGKRVAPMVYEKKLDSPMSGLAQGFIFFPRQENDNFRIAVRGLLPETETFFAFRGDGAGAMIATAPAENSAANAQKGERRPEEVVVKIPTTKPPAPPTAPDPPLVSADPDFSLEGETYPPAAMEIKPAAPPELSPGEQPPSRVVEDQPRAAPLIPPKQVLDIFLRAWIAGDSDRMYEQLSADSQSRVSKELFSKEVLSAGGFRKGLREGYRVSWEGDSAKVTVSQKVLLVRTLSSKRIDFVMEGGAARIAW